MAICSNCGAKIDELNLICVDVNEFIAFIKDGKLNYRIEETPDEDEETYSCPCCNAILAHSIEKAKQILLGL